MFLYPLETTREIFIIIIISTTNPHCNSINKIYPRIFFIMILKDFEMKVKDISFKVS